MYIQVNGKQVTLAGMVADDYMLEQGYFEYNKELPVLNADEAFEWDDTTKSIIAISTLTEAILVQRAEALLKVCDSISPLRWDSFTKAEKDEWIIFRRKLVAVLKDPTSNLALPLPTQPKDLNKLGSHVMPLM